MASVNKAIIVGNLGADPELRYLPSGEAVANLRIATTDTWKDKEGNKQESTEWHRVSFFGRLAEVCGQYLKKSSQVYVEGSIRTRKWQDKEGQDRYTTEIRGDRLQMLGRREGAAESTTNAGQPRQAQARATGGGAGSNGAPAASGSGFNDFEDDLPFLELHMAYDPILRRLDRVKRIRV